MEDRPIGDGTALRHSIVVSCGVERAFHLWTGGIDRWWPKHHSRSGDSETTVTLEPRSGGRLYERTPQGRELEWGRVMRWEPPHLLTYNWYLGSSSDQPSEVTVRFTEDQPGQTTVDVYHRGPELLGAVWEARQEGFGKSWKAVCSAFAAHTAEKVDQRSHINERSNSGGLR